jgi:3D (Asp-Asp-Asp) domain-containing protein
MFFKKFSREISLGLALITIIPDAIIYKILQQFSNSKVISLIPLNSNQIAEQDKDIIEKMRPSFAILPLFKNQVSKIIYMKVTGYHSQHCAQKDYLRGRTASWASACNTHGVASDLSRLPLGTMLYIDDDRIDPNERLRVVDDGCETCEENGKKGIYHIDVRFLEYKERYPKNNGFVNASTEYDGKDDIPVLILRWGKDQSSKILERKYK